MNLLFIYVADQISILEFSGLKPKIWHENKRILFAKKRKTINLFPNELR